MRANIFKDIEKIKAKLVLRAKSKGIYENFGQKEYTDLKDKWNKYIIAFPNSAKAINEQLDLFFNWCINFDDNELNILRWYFATKKRA